MPYSTKFNRVSAWDVIERFLEHVRDNWQTYKNNLPQLRRTLMFYDIYVHAIRYLPENSDYSLEFNPKYPLLEDLPRVFGKRHYRKYIGEMVYGAWPSFYLTEPGFGYVNADVVDSPHSCMTVKEFPAQKKFLDSIRNHPRIAKAFKLREIAIEKEKRRNKKLLVKVGGKLDTSKTPTLRRLQQVLKSMQ